MASVALSGFHSGTLGSVSGQVTSAEVIPAGRSREVWCKVIGVAASSGAVMSAAIPLANGRAEYFASRT